MFQSDIFGDLYLGYEISQLIEACVPQCVSHFFIGVTKYLRNGRLILAYGFRRFSPWSPGSIARGLCSGKTSGREWVVEQSCVS
jgi:hypothetical protein